MNNTARRTHGRDETTSRLGCSVLADSLPPNLRYKIVDYWRSIAQGVGRAFACIVDPRRLIVVDVAHTNFDACAVQRLWCCQACRICLLLLLGSLAAEYTVEVPRAGSHDSMQE